MTAPVFDWGESSQLTLDEQPRVRATRFGDGYEQRSSDGINSSARTWDLNFEMADDDIADDIVEFLRARAGVEAFDWTPKWETSAIRVKCPQWSRRPDGTPGDGLSRISARFEEVFEP